MDYASGKHLLLMVLVTRLEGRRLICRAFAWLAERAKEQWGDCWDRAKGARWDHEQAGFMQSKNWSWPRCLIARMLGDVGWYGLLLCRLGTGLSAPKPIDRCGESREPHPCQNLPCLCFRSNEAGHAKDGQGPFMHHWLLLIPSLIFQHIRLFLERVPYGSIVA